jgi:hypothetical protein
MAPNVVPVPADSDGDVDAEAAQRLVTEPGHVIGDRQPGCDRTERIVLMRMRAIA